MGIRLRDHFDFDKISFVEFPNFWEVMIHTALEEGAEIKSEDDFIESISSEAKEDYLKMKKDNPEWKFPEL